MRNVGFLLLAIALTSCLKKIKEVDTANTNIFDPDYAGEQWWVYDDVYIWTNSNNDQKIHFDFHIPEDVAPDLKPTIISTSVKVNGGNPIYVDLPHKSSGDYEGDLDINPTGTTNFCLEIGVYVEEDSLIINEFTECMNL